MSEVRNFQVFVDVCLLEVSFEASESALGLLEKLLVLALLDDVRLRGMDRLALLRGCLRVGIFGELHLLK